VGRGHLPQGVGRGGVCRRAWDEGRLPQGVGRGASAAGRGTRASAAGRGAYPAFHRGQETQSPALLSPAPLSCAGPVDEWVRLLQNALSGGCQGPLLTAKKKKKCLTPGPRPRDGRVERATTQETAHNSTREQACIY